MINDSKVNNNLAQVFDHLSIICPHWNDKNMIHLLLSTQNVAHQYAIFKPRMDLWIYFPATRQFV